MDGVAQSIFQSFLNAAVPPPKHPPTDKTLLADLGFDGPTYVLCAKYLADVLGELFPDVRRAVLSCFSCC